jgi:hypothetical protein
MSQARLRKIFHESLPVVLLSKVHALDADKTLLFINRLIACFKSALYAQGMTESPFAIILDPSKIGTGKDYLDPNIITQWKANSCNVLTVDYDGRQIVDQTYDDVVIDGDDAASDLSKDHQLILFYIRQLAIKVYANGYCIQSTDNIHSMKRTGEVRSTDLPPSQYRLLINKHFNEKLLRGKKVRYWHDKQTRILKQKPEDYFRDELHEYLKENLTPEGLAEKDIPNAGTNDEIDIRILDSTNGVEFIIIEVKWMGKAISIKQDKSIGETEFSDDSPNAGIHQLGIYLQDEPRARLGCLVTYDARLNAENTEIVWNSADNTWHIKIDKPPIRLYIKSESASQEGKKLAQRDKKQQKNKNS